MKERYFELYSFSVFPLVVAVRILLVLFALLLLFISLTSSFDLNFSLYVLAAVVINELFLESVKRAVPSEKVTAIPKNITSTMIFSARQKFAHAKNGYDMVRAIASTREVKFFREKLGITTVGHADVTGDELPKQAAEAAAWVEGNFITEIDLFAAYILLSEDKTRFLQTNNLNNDDVINVLYWTRRKFKPDVFGAAKIQLFGDGVFDSLVYGWNYELKKYSRDLTSLVLAHHFPPSLLGREKEYKELIVALSKHASSNAVLLGEAGVGKSSLVERLAYDSFIGGLPHEISKRRVFSLMVDRIISGVSNSGELESRLGAVLSEIAHSHDAIVYIPNLENVFGGGGFEFDISGLLAEYLNGTRIKIVGSTTPQGYATYIQPRQEISESFEKIELDELPEGRALLLLTDKAGEFESKYGIQIMYPALKQTVNLSSVYFPDRFSPARDVDLLEDVSSKSNIDRKRRIDGNDVIQYVQSKTNVVLTEPDLDEKELLINLEEKMHQRIIGQDEAVNAVATAMRRLRSGFKNEDRPIASFLFLGPTGVGKTETAKALAAEYFGRRPGAAPEGSARREGSGPAGRRDSMIRLDMSEYQTQEQLTRLLGAGSGEAYVANTLTEQVEKNPFSLILLDEFEKAHPHLLDLFLQVFDEGRLTDNRGKTVSFKNTIIIATSNAGTEFLRERQNSGLAPEKQELIDYILKSATFKPELINRFDEIVVFRFLNQEEIKKVARILLMESLAELEDNQIKVQFEDKILEKISKEAYNPEFGARNIRRYIEDRIEGFISKEILSDHIKKGERVNLSVDSLDNFVVT